MAFDDFKILKETLSKFGDDVVESAQLNLGVYRTIRGKRARRVASGTLQNDLKYTFWKRGQVTLLLFTTNQKSTRDYADVIEMGRRPNSTPPPYAPILKWMEIKRIQIRDFKTKKFIKATEAQKIFVAKRIAKSIGKKGIEGIRYYGEAIEKQLDIYGTDFLDALNAEVQLRIKADKYL